MKKTVLFFVNDFGFGPASRAATIAMALKHDHPEHDVRLVSTGLSDYLFSEQLVIDTISDIRNVSVISAYLSKFEASHTLIVSTMNRFAVIAAKEKGMKTVLVDGLYWFWRKRPVEYDSADYQIKCVLPWLLPQYSHEANAHTIIVASPIEYTAKANTTRQTPKRLINTNGYLTPFHTKGHDVYLDYLQLFLQRTRQKTVVTTSPYAIQYMSPSVHNDAVQLRSLNKADYQQSVSEASEILLNGGSNSFLEVLVANKPFIFFLPSNQSQFALIEAVARYTGLPMERLCPAAEDVPHITTIGNFETEGPALEYLSTQLMSFFTDNNARVAIENTLKKYEGAATILYTHPKIQELIATAQNSLTATENIASFLEKIIQT